jgi:Tol biopolymer transport system component
MNPFLGSKFIKRSSLAFFVVFSLVWGTGASPQTLLLPGTTWRVSVDSNGLEANEESKYPSISGDGRYVVFYSTADNLVVDDFNGLGDVFIHNRETATTERVTEWGGGGQPNISADGRYIAFASSDNSLVPGDINGLIDIFVYEYQTEAVERVSVNSEGQEGNGHSTEPTISTDGRYITFRSFATNLSTVPNGGWLQIFIHDRQTGITELVSVNSAGEAGLGFYGQYAQVSADGRYVAFASSANNLVLDDTNGVSDIFVRDRQEGITQRVSVSSKGEQGNGDSISSSISADGHYVLFDSGSSNFVPDDTNNRGDLFVHDLWTGETELVSLNTEGEQGNNTSGGASISANGRYIAFQSLATNLVMSDTNDLLDVFRGDRLLGITERMNVNLQGEEANGFSGSSSLSAEGSHTTFTSGANNLVPDDLNEFYDVFARERLHAALALNHSTGAPGSYFTLVVSNFPLTNTAAISVNDYLLGSIPTDFTGTFTVTLSTENATPGAYMVTAVTDPYQASATFILDEDDPIWPLESGGPVFDIPGGIAFQLFYLPLIVHQ